MTSEHDLTLQTDRMQAKIEDGIGWMVFNNPARHNALSLEMWEGIGDILSTSPATTRARHRHAWCWRQILRVWRRYFGI